MVYTLSSKELPSERENVSTVKYYFKVLECSANYLSYILLGCVLIVNFWFVFNGSPFDPYRQHVFYCVLGYQVLMALSILSLSPSNGWSSSMSVLHQRRAHWVIQIAGSGFAIAGSIIEMIYQNGHFYTKHGTYGIIALIFTVISLINGVSSLYAAQLRPFIPPSVSKISHIVFGTATFAFAGASLYCGYDHWTFKEWSSDEMVYLMMALTAIYTIVVILTPCWTFCKRVYSVAKN